MADNEQPSVLKSIASNTAAVATLLSFVIGLPSLIFTWNNQGNERARAFAQAVDQEEARWNRLYELYYAALQEEANQKPVKLVEARLQAVCRLASKPAADFKAFPLGTVFPQSDTPQHQAEQARMALLRDGLTAMLLDPERSSKDTAKCVEDQLSDQLATENTKRERVEAPVTAPGGAMTQPPKVVAVEVETTKAEVSAAQPVTSQQPAQLDPAQQPASVTLSSGSANGWDIDVFWCEGPHASNNLTVAMKAATRTIGMKSLANSGPVGRVRLRMLSLERQADAGYRPVGLEVRGESGERSAVDVLAKALSLADEKYRYRPSTQVTPWYLSVFVCQP